MTADDKSFDSEGLDTAGAWQRAFTKPGTYRYFCELHPYMKAMIVAFLWMSRPSTYSRLEQTAARNRKRTISDGGGLAIDSNNLLYVANSKTAMIDIFPSGSGTMETQIGGSNTGLVAPGTVAIDASRNVYVYVYVNTTATISEFAAGATGNVVPIRTIAGSNTGLTIGDGFNCALAVSKNTGSIFVSNPTSNAILVFAATASGNVAPIQTIVGSATQLSNPLGLRVTQ